jgi:hypothetical protein
MKDTQLAEFLAEAFRVRYELCGPFDGNWVELCLAETIRKLVDEMLPYQKEPVISKEVTESFLRRVHFWQSTQNLREELLRIAEIMENSDS